MEIDAVDKLVFHVIEKVAEDECLLDEVVEFVISFSREHSLLPETLLKLSFIFGNDKMHRERYVFSRASALLFSGKMQEDAHMEAGKTASLLGLGNLAAREFEEVLEDNPENIEALCGYGAMLARLGKLEAARAQYERALEIHPYHIDTLCHYGCLLYRLRDTDGAEEAYKKALLLDPRHVGAHCGYGILLYKRGQMNDANYHFSRALELDPGHVESNFHYARLLVEKGEPLEIGRAHV